MERRGGGVCAHQVRVPERVELGGRDFGNVALQTGDVERVEYPLLACVSGSAVDITLMLLSSCGIGVGLVLDDVRVGDDQACQHPIVLDGRRCEG